MKKLLYILFLGMVIIIPQIAVFATGQSGNEGTEDSIIIRFGYKSSTETDQHKIFSAMSKSVQEHTDGRIDIQLFPNGLLGENKEIVEQARLGSDVMGQTSPGDLGEYVPDYGILPGPYLFDSWDDFQKLAHSDLVAGWNNELAEKAGIKVVGYMYFGVRDFYVRNADITSIEDLKGLKIRVQPVKIYTEMIKALGAVPTPLPWTEVYSALSQGVIDGAEAPPRAIYDYKHFENVKSLLLDDHIVDVSAIYLSNKTLEKISATDRTILLNELNKALDNISQSNIQSRNSYVQKIEESGVKVIKNVNRNEFKNAVLDVYNQFPEWSPNLYQEIKEILAK